MQAVHELRHKCHARELHAQVLQLLSPGGIYLVCDHYLGEGGMANDRLYMTPQKTPCAAQDSLAWFGSCWSEA
jgi:predicted methyltransferase